MDTLAPTDDLAEIEARLRMPFVDAARTQRAVRRVHPDPIDERIVVRLIEVALEAPTGSNGQNWEFVVVTDPEVRAAFAAQYRRLWKVGSGAYRRRNERDEQMARVFRSVQWQVEHFEEIPVLVVCCLRGGYKIPFVPSLPTMATAHYGSIYPSVQNLLLAARAVGLGASLITIPLWSTTIARRILGLPMSVEPCCMVPIGWPRGRYGDKARKPVGTVVHRNRYGERVGESERR